jgi:hypothetical protein
MLKRMIAVVFVLALIFMGAGFANAQNESYLDTLYQALEEGTGQAVSPEEPDGSVNIDIDLTDEEALDILVGSDLPGIEPVEGEDESEGETADEAEQEPEPVLTEAELKINGILNDLVRILSSQFGGLVPTINLVDLMPTPEDPVEDDGNTGDDDGNTGDDDGNTGDDNGDTGDDNGNTGDDDGNTGDDDGNTGDDNGNTGDDNGNTGDDNGNTGDDDDTEVVVDSVEAIQAFIQEAYGLETKAGTSDWSMRQLELLDEVLAKLPKGFYECTEAITRDANDSPDRPDDGSTLAYVKTLELEIHVLDRAVAMSAEQQQYIETQMREQREAWFITNFEIVHDRAPTEAEIKENVDEYVNKNLSTFVKEFAERDLKHTYVHEMTHCLQNYHPNIFREWQNTFWPNNERRGESPSNYGNTLSYEDMAECFAYFIIGEGELTDDGYETYDGGTIDLERYEFVKRIMNQLGGDY